MSTSTERWLGIDCNTRGICADDGDAVVDQVHARGLHPETVLVRRSTLEDVFLRLTGRSLND